MSFKFDFVKVKVKNGKLNVTLINPPLALDGGEILGIKLGMKKKITKIKYGLCICKI